MKQEKNSPLKDKPLRMPGQSVQEQINKMVDNELAFNLFPVLSSVSFMIMTLWLQHTNTKLSFFILLSFVLLVVIYSVVRIVIFQKKIKALKLGRDGEKVVGQYIDQFRTEGCRVFHDVQGEGFNLDHIYVSKSGIFVIETKTYSKNKNSEIVFKNNSLFVGDYNTGDKLLIQAKSQAKWLKEMLKESTGRNYPVQPIIVFPGWYVKANNHLSEVWVLNPKGLLTFMNNSKEEVSKEDVILASYHISRYVRSY